MPWLVGGAKGRDLRGAVASTRYPRWAAQGHAAPNKDDQSPSAADSRARSLSVGRRNPRWSQAAVAPLDISSLPDGLARNLALAHAGIVAWATITTAFASLLSRLVIESTTAIKELVASESGGRIREPSL